MRHLFPTVAIVLTLTSAIYFAATSFIEATMPNERQVLDKIIVGGQPSRGDLEAFAQKGVTLIVNARVPGEFRAFDEEEYVTRLGMTYINIPIHGQDSYDAEAARKLYDAMQATDGKIVIHCTVGMRASALLALEQYLFEGITKDEAKTLASKAHMAHMESIVEDIIDRLERQ